MLDREDKAKELLKEAGVEPNTLSIELLYNTSENNKNTMAAIADQLGNIGVKATLNETEGATYFNFLREDGPFDIARAGWIGDYNDPQNFLYIAQSDVSFNYSKVKTRNMMRRWLKQRRFLIWMPAPRFWLKPSSSSSMT